ncbi:MAG TPA: CBS domain-containing protein [Chloroflexota bacterium]|nr:CBS domain-containing protein [Chloroflexota bacterium]
MPFFSEIVGRSVVDSASHHVGKVVDLVVSSDATYPIITAIAVAAKGRKNPTFVPWEEVVSLEQPVVLRHGLDQIKPHAPRDGELCLGTQILDRQIVDVEGHKVVRANDLRLARTNGHYRLIGVDIGGQALLRRLGLYPLSKRLGMDAKENFIAWEDVDPLASRDVKGIKLRVSHDALSKLHPADIAEIVEELSIKEGVALLESMDDETVAEALEEVAPEKQVSLLQEMTNARAADILEEMDPDDAADVLGDMSEEKQLELLREMEPEERVEVRELLGYPEYSAGGIMTTEYLAVPVTFTAAQAMERLRAEANKVDVIDYIYVVADMESEELLGVLSLRDLIVAAPETPVRQLMKEDPVSLRTEDDQEHAARVIAKYNLLAVPVVDAQNRLQGIVTVDDAIDIILPTAWKKRLPRVFA